MITKQFSKQILVFLFIAISQLGIANVVLENPQNTGQRYLFYRSDSTITRFSCGAGQISYSPSNCKLMPPLTANAGSLYDFIYRLVGKGIAESDKVMSESGAQIRAIDEAIDELTSNSDSGSTDQEEKILILKKALENEKQHLQQLTIESDQLQKQLDALQLNNQNQPSGDLVKQILSAKEKLTKLIIDRNISLDSVAKQRLNYLSLISINETIKPRIDLLTSQRRKLSAVYISALERSTAEAPNLRATVQFLQTIVDDKAITYEIENAKIGTPEAPYLEIRNFNQYFELQFYRAIDDVWFDVTKASDGFTPSNCDAHPANCTLYDRYTNRSWDSSGGDWCSDQHSHNGNFGWRTPSREELDSAANHNIAYTESYPHWVANGYFNRYFISSWYFSGPNCAYATSVLVDLRTGAHVSRCEPKEFNRICVRKGIR